MNRDIRQTGDSQSAADRSIKGGHAPDANPLSPRRAAALRVAAVGRVGRRRTNSVALLALGVAIVAASPGPATGAFKLHEGGAKRALLAHRASTDRTPPTMPRRLHAVSSTATSVTVAWGKSSDRGGLAGYDVYLDDTRVGGTLPRTTGATVASLRCGTSYVVGVEAFDRAGNRSARAIVVVATAPCVDDRPPTAPAGVTPGDVSATSVTLSWQASTDDFGVVAYEVLRDGALAGSTASTLFSVTGLACGMMYTLGVRALDGGGNRSAASSVLAMTSDCPDTTPPSAPAGLAVAYADETSLSVRWAAAGDDRGVLGYRVFQDGAAVGSTTVTAYTIDALECGRSYVIAVEAYDAAGNRSGRTQITAATAPCPPPPPTEPTDTTPPTAPTGLAASSVTSSSISLRWNVSTDDTAVAGYGLYRDDASAGTAAGTSATLGGLECGRSYRLSVDAFDARGNRSSRSSVTATTDACPDTTPPSTPTGLRQTATTETTLTVAWAPSTDDFGVAGYGIYLAGVRVADTAAPAHTLGSLACGTTFTVGVDAYDAAGHRSPQAALHVATSACPADTEAPSIPAERTVSGATTTSFTLAWSAASDNVGVAGYRVVLDGATVATTTSRSHTYSGLACGTEYTVGVSAYDAAGNTSAVATAPARTSACPPPADTLPPSPPTGLVATNVSESSATLGWSTSSDNVGVTGYGYYRDGSLVGSGTATGFTFSGLGCGTTPTLGVDAFDAAGNRSSRTVLAVATAPCPPPSSGGAQRFVSTVGSDAGVCSAVAPCRSFDRAYRVAAPGEVVEVAAGSYPSQRIDKDASKTSASDVVFRPAAGATVTLAYLDIAGSHLEVRDLTATAGVDVDSNPIDTRDVTLRNISGRSLFLRADDVSVIGGSYGGFNGCDAGMPEDGVKLWSDSSRGADGITLDGVLIHDIRRTGCDRHTDCIQIYSGTNHTIKNSTLVNCPTTGIIARPSGSSQALANITIENNYFGSVLDGSEAINIGTSPDRCSGIVVRYNTVVNESSSFDCVTPSGSPGSLVEGNIISIGAGNDAVFRWNVFRPGSAVTGTGAVQCAPSYRNASAGDWRLTATDSCARGRGNSQSHPTADHEGEPRPQGTIDAGADETD